MYAYPLGKKQTWFARKRDKPVSFSTKLQGDNRTIERLTRPNSLFLSAAAQNNHEALPPLYSWFTKLLFVIGERSTTGLLAGSLYRDGDLRGKLAQVVSSADLGVTDLSIRAVELTAVAEIMKAMLKSQSTDKLGEFEDEWEIQFFHRIGNSTRLFHEEQESKGTIAFLCLLDPVFRALRNGGVVCVDELDDSLHPLLAIEVIRQFSDINTNPAFAQLIFNTHDSEREARRRSDQNLRYDRV